MAFFYVCMVGKVLAQFELVVLSRYLSKIVLVLVILLFGWSIGSIFSFYLAPSQELVSPVLGNDNRLSVQNPSTNPSRVVPVYLLGRQFTLGSPSKGEAVTETKLNLIILGVLSVSAERGVAIIKSGSETLLVATGEEIQRGVLLEAVYSAHVVIDNNGVSEKLAMDSSNEFLESNLSYLKNNAQEANSLPKDVAQKLKRSPASITQYVRFQIVRKNGGLSGIKLWPKNERDTTIFKGLGFESGDLLTRVNGKSVDQLMKNVTLWKKMLNETTLEMEVVRQGGQEFFVVNLN